MSHPKGVLLERAQKLGLPKPEFRTEQTGPEHEPRFISDVVVDGEVLGTGQGGTKRTAEKYAAEEALAALDTRGQEDAKSAGKGADKGGGKGAEKAKGKSAGKSGGRADDVGTGRTKGKDGKSADAGASKGKPAASAPGAVPMAASQERVNTEVETMPNGAEEQDEEFDGPWPMFDDLLAAVVGVAERRVSSDLRGDAARDAIRDFSLDLYKDLLMGLGDLVEEDDDEEEEEDD